MIQGGRNCNKLQTFVVFTLKQLFLFPLKARLVEKPEGSVVLVSRNVDASQMSTLQKKTLGV